MWDQDWSTQTLKLKKQKKKTTTDNLKYELAENIQEKDKTKEFDTLSEEYIKQLAGEKKVNITKEVVELSKEFAYLFELGELLPVKKPYLAGYPAWYRKLCTKPGKDPDWTPGANNITTSMQVSYY